MARDVEVPHMKVCGIDPAPTKGLAVFDGEDHQVQIKDAAALVTTLAKADDCLVCWDAPLTGPPTAVLGGSLVARAAFSQRPIESFFSRSGTGFKTPKGVSVLGYSGCPHWALTRSLLGLPRVGRFDAQPEALPFRLLTADCQRPTSGACVVEVHPAVALWLWCRDRRNMEADWRYKKDRTILLELWEHLQAMPSVASALVEARIAPSSDDELDARVSYALGWLWLNNPSSVVLLGDADTGTFLVPRVAGIEEAFGLFIHEWPRDDEMLSTSRPATVVDNCGPSRLVT